MMGFLSADGVKVIFAGAYFSLEPAVVSLFAR
jgi:hypothetical protein